MPDRPTTAARSLRSASRAAAASLVLAGATVAVAAAPAPPPAPSTAPAPALLELDSVDAVRRGVELLLGMQESMDAGEDAANDAPDEWPYEGVYRVRGSIPMGYRIGGTSIVARALLTAPGWANDPARRDAVDRAAAFVCAGTEHPAMQFPYPPRYDVRGWGYTYALQFLLDYAASGRVRAERQEAVAAATAYYLRAIEATALESGGWNYAQRPNRSVQAPFMTGPTLMALFTAEAHGHPVDRATVDAALDALERGRGENGAMQYSGDAGGRRADTVEGATGRMLITETALDLAGRGDADRLRTAVDAFFDHWEWLEKRRRQNGTHVPPHGVAPYYFFYAHHAAGLAIERLPQAERDAARARLRDRFATVREDDGAWNDRVFDRSANYGTAMTMLALTMPDRPGPATRPAAAASVADDAADADADADAEGLTPGRPDHFFRRYSICIAVHGSPYITSCIFIVK